MASILIIEDSPITARLEARYLVKAGHTCRSVASGREALELIAIDPPDVIILDYLLPDIDGLKLLKAILEREPQALVIMVTGQGHERLAVEIMKSGAKDYITKTGAFYEPLVLVVENVLEAERNKNAFEAQALQNERLAAQNEISFWMAHNFKNMLSGALGFLSLVDLTDDRQSLAKRQEYLREVELSLQRALRLMDQLLNLSSLDSSFQDQVDIEDLVTSAFQRARAQVSGSLPVIFRFDCLTPDLSMVKLAVADARLVFDALIQNALEALDEPGQVVITAEIKGSCLELKVKDNGHGMTEEIMNKAVEPLFSTKGTVGVGLGLSLVKAALRRNGGNLTLESTPGQGTTAIVFWPLNFLDA